MYFNRPGTDTRSSAVRSGALFTAVVREWRILLGLAVLGVLAGAVVTLLMPNRYTATSSVYMGQTMDANGAPVAGVDSDARALIQLLSSDEVLGEAARRTGMGMTPADLGRNTAVTMGGIAIIAVTDEDSRRAVLAVDALAEVLLEQVAAGVDEKIATLEQQLTSSRAALARSEERSRNAQDGLQALAKNGSARQQAVSHLSIIQAASGEQQALRAANQKAELVLLTARQIERPRILYAAQMPDEPSGPSISFNIALGALAGFLLALVVLPIRWLVARRRSL